MPERKPLELTVYPRRGRETYVVSVSPWVCLGEVAVDRRSEAKRLNDAELAAEYWRVTFLYENSLAQNDGYDGATETAAYRRQWMTLNRFATHPNYDQEDQ